MALRWNEEAGPAAPLLQPDSRELATMGTAEGISAGSQAKAIISPVERLDHTHWLQANDLPPHRLGNSERWTSSSVWTTRRAATSDIEAIDSLQKTNHLE